jgi:hypothetical protein
MEFNMENTDLHEHDTLDIRDFEYMIWENAFAATVGLYNVGGWQEAEVIHQTKQKTIYFDWGYTNDQCWSTFTLDEIGGGGSFKLVHPMLAECYEYTFSSAQNLLKQLEVVTGSLEKGSKDESAYLPFAFSISVLKKALKRVAKRRLLAQKIYTS